MHGFSGSTINYEYRFYHNNRFCEPEKQPKTCVIFLNQNFTKLSILFIISLQFVSNFADYEGEQDGY